MARNYPWSMRVRKRLSMVWVLGESMVYRIFISCENDRSQMGQYGVCIEYRVAEHNMASLRRQTSTTIVEELWYDRIIWSSIKHHQFFSPFR